MELAKPSAVRFTLVAVALVLAVVGQLLVDAGNLRWAITPFLVAVIAIGLAAGSRPATSFAGDASGRSEPQGSVAASSLRTRRFWGPERLFGLACLITSLGFIAVSLWRFAAGPPNTLAWYLFGASALLLFAALPTIELRWTHLVRRLRDRGRVSFELRAALPWAGLGAVLLLALLVRVYDLQEIPPGLWHDEADNLAEARQIQLDPGAAPVFVPSTNLPSLFLMPIAVVIDLTGISMAAGRLVSVAFGLAGVVAVFLLVRLMLGPFVGLMAAFLTAVMRWDIIWSRIGMHGITAPLFAALSAWLLLRALKSGRTSDFGFAGAALGLGMWFYASYRLFPLVLGFILVHHVVSRRPRLRRFALQVIVLAAVSLMVAAPVVQSAVVDSDEFFARTESTSVFSLMSFGDAVEAVFRSVDDHGLMLNYKGDTNPRHNIPSEPMLDFWSAALLVLGLGVALARWREVALITVPFWLLAMALPGMLTLPWEAPQSLRAIGMIPAVAIAIALALGVIWTAGRSAPWPMVRGLTPVVVAGLLAGIAFQNIDTYFGEQANNSEVYASFTTDQTLIARDMRRQQARGYTLLTSRQFLYGRTLSVVGDSPTYDAIRVPIGIPIDAARVTRGAAIYLEPREGSVFSLLRVYYPDGAFAEVRPPRGGDILYYSVLLSSEQLQRPTGLDARYTLLNGDVREAILSSTQGFWPLLVGPEEVPFAFEWEGALHVREPGEYTLTLEGSSGVGVALDGRLVLWDGQRSVRIEPAVGLHFLRVQGRIEDRDGFLQLLWEPPGRALESISASNLYRGSVRPLGLAGRFFESGEDEGTPNATRVTPAMGSFYYDPVVPEPYLAVWEGSVDVPDGGTYRFKVEAAGTVRLLLDGNLIVQSPGSPGVKPEASTHLDAGRHAIRVEYESPSPPSQFGVLWGSGSRSLEPIPIELLSPAPEHMFRILPGGG
ncbi:MAG: glycosyltransferase family 39 protein [Chloroflexi bacterium]|nr:glycosyltransferase family 39 protein [Chloroflexota bacterium]